MNLAQKKVDLISHSLKGWCTWHETWLQMMILRPLSRVMMVRQPFCAKNKQTSHFVCAKLSPARAVLYLQLYQALLWSNGTAQRFNTTTMAPHAGFTKPCGAIGSHTCGGVILCAVLLDHNNARFSCKYRTAWAGLNFTHKKCEVCMFFAQNGCLTTITLLTITHHHSTHHMKPCLVSSAPSL